MKSLSIDNVGDVVVNLFFWWNASSSCSAAQLTELRYLQQRYTMIDHSVNLAYTYLAELRSSMKMFTGTTFHRVLTSWHRWQTCLVFTFHSSSFYIAELTFNSCLNVEFIFLLDDKINFSNG